MNCLALAGFAHAAGTAGAQTAAELEIRKIWRIAIA
jgi:hypothetical protein